MKIGITSQNFRTITGHAGKTRRFLVYQVDDKGQIDALPNIDLPREMSLHEYQGDDHPVFALDLVITAGCGEKFRQRMRNHGVEVIATSETDPAQALRTYLAGQTLPAAAAHDHEHRGHQEANSVSAEDISLPGRR